MKPIGIISTAMTVAATAIAVVVAVRSLPDIRRYLKMRSM